MSRKLLITLFAFLVVMQFIYIPTSAMAFSSKTMYVLSDKSDELFAKKMGIKMHNYRCSIPDNITSYKVIFILDYNVDMSACKEFPQSLASAILGAASRGSTIIIGYNTIRNIYLYSPAFFKKLGLVLADDNKGNVNIHIENNALKINVPANIDYNTTRYRRYIVLAENNVRILASFSDHTPAILEQPIGKGRIVFVLFNPIWPVDENHKEYINLIKALYDYYIEPNAVTEFIKAGFLTSLVVASVSYVQSSSDTVIKRLEKPLIVSLLLAHRSDRSKILSHPTRQRIVGLFDSKSYIDLADVMNMGVSRSTALWHLDFLVSGGILRGYKIAGKQIYCLRGGCKRAILVYLMESKHRRLIIERLMTETLTITKVAERLGISKSTAKHHLDVLSSYGIVDEVGYGYVLSEWVRRIIKDVIREKNKGQ